jgi:glycosyltransferase involved in cell wall biosynthesis
MYAQGFYGYDYRDIVTKSVINVDIPIANNIGTRLFESNAMGTPVMRIANEAPGFNEYFIDNENVFLIEPGDLKSLLMRIDMILSLGPGEKYNNQCKKIIDLSKDQSYTNRILYVLKDLELIK